MLRRFVGAVLALVICAGSLLAEEIKGKVAAPAQSPAAQDTGTNAQDRAIAWLATWKQALAEAKRTEKPILLAFGKPACEGVPGLW